MVDEKGRLTCQRRLSAQERKSILDLAATVGWSYKVERDPDSASRYSLRVTRPGRDDSSRFNCWYPNDLLLHENEQLACLIITGGLRKELLKDLGVSAGLDLTLALAPIFLQGLISEGTQVRPEPYKFMFGLDWRSTYKSLWLGWWLVTWTIERHPWRIRDLSVEFQPGL